LHECGVRGATVARDLPAVASVANVRRRFNELKPRIILADGQPRPPLDAPRENGAIGATGKNVRNKANREMRWPVLTTTA